MINRFLHHPALRSKPDGWLLQRTSFLIKFFFPVDEQIGWYGDIQLYCRQQDYQNVLDEVPCATSEYKGYRACALEGADLDQYRTRVQVWLNQFDEMGNRLIGAPKPKFTKLENSTPPSITAGPVEPVGSKLTRWMRGGRP